MEILTLQTSRECSQEKEYVFSILFKELLGLDYKVEYLDDAQHFFRLSFAPNKVLLIRDAFFKNFSRSGEYLKAAFLPQAISYTTNQFLTEENIPVLYGDDECTVSEQQIICGIDLFASSFFMLSRWEELVIETRDAHDRFPATASMAYKYHFLDRPVVDEYVEMLWNMLLFLGYPMPRKSRDGKTLVSCDVDTPIRCSSFYQAMRACLGSLVKSNAPLLATKMLRAYLCNKAGRYHHDPYYTFDWYMRLLESIDLKATFYFIADSTEPNNGNYRLEQKYILRLMENIAKRGHTVGMHGSYQTYENPEKIKQEKVRLERAMSLAAIQQNRIGNRQHFLRWNSACTPDYLAAAGFDYDTTGGYADIAGFRFGTSHEFSMWGWRSKTGLALKQKPLIVMDCSVTGVRYMNMGYGDMAAKYMDDLRVKCMRYSGNFSLLWHNSYLELKNKKNFFAQIIAK